MEDSEESNGHLATVETVVLCGIFLLVYPLVTYKKEGRKERGRCEEGTRKDERKDGRKERKGRGREWITREKERNGWSDRAECIRAREGERERERKEEREKERERRI